MNCIILQNTYCACLDLASQLRSQWDDIRIVHMAEEAMQVIDWIGTGKGDDLPDFIIADPEACDGDTLDVFRRAELNVPLILTCSSPDIAIKEKGLNIAGRLLKPISSESLIKAIYENHFTPSAQTDGHSFYDNKLKYANI